MGIKYCPIWIIILANASGKLILILLHPNLHQFPTFPASESIKNDKIVANLQI